MEKSADRKEYLRNYYQTHKERYKETVKIWRNSHPEKVKEYNHRQYERRKALRQEQKGSGEDA